LRKYNTPCLTKCKSTLELVSLIKSSQNWFTSFNIDSYIADQPTTLKMYVEFNVVIRIKKTYLIFCLYIKSLVLKNILSTKRQSRLDKKWIKNLHTIKKKDSLKIFINKMFIM